MNQLIVHDLKCSRGGRVIFYNVNFSLCSGEILYLKGRNGSGKSTLLRALAGLLGNLEGDIQWSQEEGVLFLDHKNTLKPYLTLFENLNFWRSIYHTSTQEIEIALEHFALAHLKNFPSQILSLGQRQCLSLCRLLLYPGKLWLLDEPARSLDHYAKKNMELLLEKHQKKGGLVIMSSHENSSSSHKNSLNLDDYQMYKEKTV